MCDCVGMRASMSGFHTCNRWCVCIRCLVGAHSLVCVHTCALHQCRLEFIVVYVLPTVWVRAPQNRVCEVCLRRRQGGSLPSKCCGIRGGRPSYYRQAYCRGGEHRWSPHPWQASAHPHPRPLLHSRTVRAKSASGGANMRRCLSGIAKCASTAPSYHHRACCRGWDEAGSVAAPSAAGIAASPSAAAAAQPPPPPPTAGEAAIRTALPRLWLPTPRDARWSWGGRWRI